MSKLRRLRENQEFKASLGYRVRPCLNPPLSKQTNTKNLQKKKKKQNQNK
jgi:hypothetical protein